MTTFISNYNLDFSGFGDEVKAYVATGYDYDTKTIWLTRVKDVPAGTALIVKGTAKETYDVPVKETSGSYYKNMLVGNLSGRRDIHQCNIWRYDELLSEGWPVPVGKR